MFYLEAALSNSYPEDLSDIVKLCNKARFACEELRPHLNIETKGVTAIADCTLEKKINEILQKMREVETRWEFKFEAKLDPLELLYYTKLMEIFKKGLVTIPKPVNFDLFAQGAMIEHTVNQIIALKEEALRLSKQNDGILEVVDSFFNKCLKRV